MVSVKDGIKCPTCSTVVAPRKITRHINAHPGPGRYPRAFAEKHSIVVCCCGAGYVNPVALARHRRVFECARDGTPCYLPPEPSSDPTVSSCAPPSGSTMDNTPLVSFTEPPQQLAPDSRPLNDLLLDELLNPNAYCLNIDLNPTTELDLLNDPQGMPLFLSCTCIPEYHVYTPQLGASLPLNSIPDKAVDCSL